MSETQEIKEITAVELPASVSDHWKKAKESVDRKNHAYAIKFLQAILQQAPGFVEGRRILRSCEVAVQGGEKKKKGGLFGSGGGLGAMRLQSQAKKDPAATLVAVEKELEEDPYSEALNEVLHDAAYRLNLLDTAAFALETVRKGNPENTKLLHKLAEFYAARAMFEQATEVYRDIIKRDPTDGEAIKGEKNSSARASMNKGGWEGSQGGSSSPRADASGDAEREKSSHQGVTRDQLTQRALKLVAKYEENPRELGTVKELAHTYEQLEDWSSAQQFYDWAFQLSDGDNSLKHKAAFMKNKAGEEHLRALKQRVTEHPDDQQAQQELEAARSQILSERLEEARKRVEQNPTDPQLRYELGDALYQSGQYSDAIPHLQQATRNPAIRSRVLLLLGRTFAAKGMIDLAIKQLKDANEELVAMDNTKKELLYELGLTYDKAQKREEALECFKEIYEVEYGYRDVAQRVEGSYQAS